MSVNGCVFLFWARLLETAHRECLLDRKNEAQTQLRRMIENNDSELAGRLGSLGMLRVEYEPLRSSIGAIEAAQCPS